MNSLQQFKEHTGTLPATSWLEIVKDNEIESICYLPVCSDGQEERCSMLGMKFVLGRHSYNSHPSIINDSQVTESVKGDGECDTHCIISQADLLSLQSDRIRNITVISNLKRCLATSNDFTLHDYRNVV